MPVKKQWIQTATVGVDEETGALIVKVAGGSMFVGLVNWRGDWNAQTAYEEGDAVASDGSSYLAVEPSTNDLPPSANWVLLAQKGAKGDQGETGDQGSQGERGPEGPGLGEVDHTVTSDEATAGTISITLPEHTVRPLVFYRTAAGAKVEDFSTVGTSTSVTLTAGATAFVAGDVVTVLVTGA
jgi:hypothetical protein